jgi:ABC-type sugar transport system substrate-binding protein
MSKGSRTARWSTIALVAIFILGASGLATPAQAAKKKLTIGFVTHVIGNPFIQQIIDAAQQAATDLGVTLKVAGPSGGEADAQLTAAQNLVAAGIDGLAISVPSASMVNGLNKIIDDGTPIVTFNLLQAAVKAPYVGEKSVQSGRILGAKVLEALGGSTAKGEVILGNCFPGFPVLENRAKGVKESLAKAPGIKVLGPYDVKVAAAENFAKWQGLLAANPKASALVGLCAPDITSIGKVAAGAPGSKFVGGGYDLTTGNLAALADGTAQISLGQTPFMQGYLPVYMLVDAIRHHTKLKLGFVDAGTEIVTKDSVTEPYGLPALTFAELQKISASKADSRKYYQPLVTDVIKHWRKYFKPISAESK